jgi:DNA-binding HxlR family transcriptional regulator
MGNKRTYGDACGVARALDRVGERWALMVVRELLLGPKRFTDLRTGLPGVSADVLAQRLRELEEAGVVAKRRLPPPAASQVYELTGWGRELEPVVLALGRWGARAAAPPEGDGMSLDAHLVSLRTLFDAERAGGFRGRVALRLDGDDFHAIVGDDGIEAGRGGCEAPDATITSAAGTLIALLHGRRDMPEALAAGDVELAGDRDLVERFLRLFPLPEPAPV